MNSEIIAIGSELLTPHRQDTNSLFVTERLNTLGVSVVFKTIVGDRPRHLISAIQTALSRTDIIVIMGGLGPTEDDLTREAAAHSLGIALKRDHTILAGLYTRAAERRSTMTRNNEKQSDILEGAIVLENPRGTAPGQWLDTVYGKHRKLVLLLPGPPSELKPMFDEQCMPLFKELLPNRFMAVRTLKVALIGESAADARIAPIYQQYSDVETTILAHLGDIQLSLVCTKATMPAARARVDELAGKIEEELEDLIYSSEGETLEQIVLYYLGMKASTLSVAESCTGGLVAERLTSISGASRSFWGGAVVYSNELKTELAGVPADMIERHGAVSREVAGALAEGIRLRCDTTYGLGVTGIAGPTGGSEEKPVGLVYIGVSDGKNTEVIERRFSGDRARIRAYASQTALDQVRRRLMQDC
ncbi:competence/damage-inducible protein A [Silvibacterium acidisoli]|uniref:competence/damage-inducible protein A n=1 Tax=Acidobacteriaceae bacterium ZG23-2 TaxID=2883246 RepID=UPI00406D275C